MKKIALVLGGSSDIGKEVVLRFLSAGWDVISHCNKNLNHLKKIKNNYPNNLILIKSDLRHTTRPHIPCVWLLHVTRNAEFGCFVYTDTT